MANNWTSDLEFGQAGEKWMSQLGQDLTMEVKRCRKWNNTGNLFFEYSCSGKPSGIMTTEALYFAYILSEKDFNIAVYVWHTESLKAAIQHLIDTKAYRTVKGGDGFRVQGLLVPIEQVGELTRLCLPQLRQTNIAV